MIDIIPPEDCHSSIHQCSMVDKVLIIVAKDVKEKESNTCGYDKIMMFYNNCLLSYVKNNK
jgi:hypothetical protein